MRRYLLSALLSIRSIAQRSERAGWVYSMTEVSLMRGDDGGGGDDPEDKRWWV